MTISDKHKKTVKNNRLKYKNSNIKRPTVYRSRPSVNYRDLAIRLIAIANSQQVMTSPARLESVTLFPFFLQQAFGNPHRQGE